jgi:hypothetical protein
VSEESERLSSGPEGNGAGVDPKAVALALAGANRDGSETHLVRDEGKAARDGLGGNAR